MIVTRDLFGSIDGVNRLFTTPEDYEAGTVVLYTNGAMRVPDYDDGFEELGGNVVYLRTSPLPGTVLQVMYNLV